MRRLRFVIVFLVLLALFEIPLLIPAVDEALVQPFTGSLAVISGAIIKAVRPDTVIQGTAILGSCFNVNIMNGCNGLEATLFLLAAVLAFPASLRLRLIGAGFGFLVVQAANLVRIVALYMTGCYRPQWFEASHLAVWQTIIFAVAVGFFIVWTRRATAQPDAVTA